MIQNSVPTYRITSISDLDVYIKKKFENDFRMELEKTSKDRDIGNIVIEISDEIKRLFKFINIIENNDKSVRKYFVYSLVVSVIVLVLSLFSLVFTAIDDVPKEYFHAMAPLNQIHLHVDR